MAGDNQRTAFIHPLWAIPVCLWEILAEILEGLNNKQQKQLGKGQPWDKELSFLTLASLSMIHLSNNKFRITWLVEQKKKKWKLSKRTLEHLLTFDFISNPKAAYGYFWKEEPAGKPVTWVSGKYKLKSRPHLDFHSSGKVNLKWGMKRM